MSDPPEDVVPVDINGRDFLMTEAEAEALTDELRATIVAKAEAIDEVKEDERRIRAVAEQQARDAAAEEGRVVVQVWCGECDEAAGPVAEIRESSQGLVFHAWRRLEVDNAPDDLRGMRRGSTGREPFVAQGGTTVLLEESTEAPAATCLTHGSGYLDTAELLERARSFEGREPTRMDFITGR